MALTYEQIMQKPGKRLSLQITYTQNGTTTTINHDNIFNAKPYYNSQLVGTIMHGFECETTTELPKDTGITLSVTARYNSDTQTRIYGPYYVKESKYNADKRDYTNECYDSFLNTMVEYQPLEDDETLNIEFPISIYDFFIALVTKCGFTTNISKLPNGGNMMESDIYTGINYTYRNVFDDIGQATASCFYLDGTEVKIAELGGNESITGKNLIGYDGGLPYTNYGITLSKGTDSYNISGTSTGWFYKKVFTIPAGTLNGSYKLKKYNVRGTSLCLVRIIDRVSSPVVSIVETTSEATFNITNSHNDLSVEIATNNTSTYNENFNIQLQLSSITDTTYEPYGNPNITIQDGTETNLVGCNIEGNSYQYTTTGKNLWQNSDYYTPLTTDNYTITDTGFTFTRNSLTGGKYIAKAIPVENGKTYVFSANLVSRNPESDLLLYLYRGNVYGTVLKIDATGKLTYTSTANETLYFTFIINSGLQSAVVSNIQVEVGNKTSYEPYTGKKPSPSPDYPQEVEVVEGQNLFSDIFNNYRYRLSYDSNTGIYAASDGDTATTLKYKIQQWSGTSGGSIISGTEVFNAINYIGTTSFTSTIVNNAQYIRIGNNGASSEFILLIPISQTGLKVGDTFTLSLELTDITIGSTKFKNVQIEKETSASEYLPYNNIGVNVVSKNILNATSTSYSGYGITIVKNENNSYTINGTNTSESTIFFRIASDFTLGVGTYTLSNSNENVSNINGAIFYDDNNNFDRENISIKTFSSSVTIKPYIKVTSGASFSNFIIYPMIENGSIATEYAPYSNITTPIDLKGNFIGKIGNVKDELSIDDLGNVILTKRIRQITLNGNESDWSDWNNKTNTIGLRLSNVQSLINIGNTDTSNVVMSNYFIKANSQDALYSQDIEGIATTSSNLYFRINKTTASSLANFKTWLSTHNTIVYYVMATPYKVNLGKANIELNEGVNYITFLTGLDTRNTIEYRSSTPQITIDDDILMNKNIEFVGKVGPINSIIITRAEESDSIYKRDETAATWYEYKIADNQLMNNNDRDTFIDDIYHKLYGITYDIYDCELTGYGGFEPFTKIRINTGDNQYNSYVFNNEMIFNQGFRENIFAEETEQTQSNYQVMDTTDKRVNEAYLILNKQNRTLTAQVERMDIIATHIDETNGNVTEVTTTTGFTFNADGLNIYTNDNTYNTQINNVGTYYKDGTTILSQTTKDGTKTKDLDIFGYNRYCEDDINDDPQFIAVKYMDANNEEGYGHFYNGV